MATIKYWDGSAWQYAVVGKQGPVGPTGPTGPAGQASLQRFRYVATGGQTSVSGTDANGNTLAYTPGLEEVFINGAAQVRGQDYTATNGTSITGITALIAGDVVEIYAWGVFNVANTISNTLIDAKGDLLVGSAADTVSRLAVGSANQVLTVDSSTATGLKWATPTDNSGMTLLSTTSLSGASTTISSISGDYRNLQLDFENVYAATDATQLHMRFNSDTGNNYSWYTLSTADGAQAAGATAQIQLSKMRNSSTTGSGSVIIFNYASTVDKACLHTFNYSDQNVIVGGSAYGTTSAITSITFLMASGNITGGTVKIYGVK